MKRFLKNIWNFVKKHPALTVLFLLLIFLVGAYINAATRDMSEQGINYLIGHAPRYSGVIIGEEVEYIVVGLNEDEPLYEEHPVIRTSKNISHTDVKHSEFPLGESVLILYDGNLTGSDPAVAETVYVILFSKKWEPPQYESE